MFISGGTQTETPFRDERTPGKEQKTNYVEVNSDYILGKKKKSLRLIKH